MELDLYFRFLLALVAVLGLIGAIAWAARRFGLGGKLIPNKGKERRLAIVEVAALDSRRKLVLLRRDRKEYLVLLGSGQDLLLDAGIEAPSVMPGGARTESRRAPGRGES